MLSTADSIQLEVDRGPNWLFVTVRPQGPKADLSHLADELWEVVSKHFIYRLVVEMDAVEKISSKVIQQLEDLRVRLEEHGGALRICGLSAPCEEDLEHYRVSDSMRNHPSRVAAVLGADSAHRLPAVSHMQAAAWQKKKDESSAAGEVSE